MANLVFGLILYNILIGLIPALSMVIWKCPEFNILNCKTPPADCLSFDMIYLRHGDLECPGCVICADPSHYDPWPAEVLRAGELRRRRDRMKVRLSSRRSRRNKLSRKKSAHDSSHPASHSLKNP